MEKIYSAFDTIITIRPDDIDQNNHVHYSKYLDYLLMARYNQMKTNYKMSMEEFQKLGYSWVASELDIKYKRGLKLSDNVIVRTQVKEVSGAHVRVLFWIIKKDLNKIAAEGSALYTMISTSSGKAVKIPEEILSRYSI